MDISIKTNDAYCDRTVLFVLKSMRLSSRMIKYLKYREDGITVNGARVTVRHTLRNGETLSLALEDSVAASCEPVKTDLDIIFENDDLIVINKPPFMPTHTSHGHYDDTLANALAGYFKSKNFPFVFRPVNRLDKNTSGLVLVAKNKFSACFLSAAMKDHKIKKSYIALLEGRLTAPDETVVTEVGELYVIRRALHRSDASVIVREICPDDAPDAAPAVTYFRILSGNDLFTMVEAFPQTGRTHQLRVHFASLGRPILGDDIYGNESELIPRHALHAHSLSFPLPPSPSAPRDSTEFITLNADIPEDIRSLAEKIFE